MSVICILILIAFSNSMSLKTDFGSIIDGDIINEPFLGGFNKPKIQWVDWDDDGDDDLFLLDEDSRIKFYKNNGCSNDECSFELIETSFQNISNISWFYIGDFNQDGNFDIITQDTEDLSAMMFYEGVLNEGVLMFVSVNVVLDINSNIVESDPVMVPTFVDIDGDDDLDFFTGNSVGTVTFYENVGFQNNLPIFEYITNYWEDIYIVGSSANQRHGASAINFIDLDEDGDYDLTWGDYFQQSLYIIWNIGDEEEVNMDNVNFLNQYPINEPAITAGLNMPSFSDVDNDGDNDLFISVLSGAYGFQLKNNFMFYEKEDDFELKTMNFLETFDLLSDINIKFEDLDSDNDLDLIVGTDFDPSDFPWSGKVWFYENVGLDINGEPIWSNVDFNLINDNEGNNFSPAFADIDLDSDLDMFVGNFNGTISFYRNESNLDGIEYVYVEDIPNIDLSGYSTPELVDIDCDQDYDLFIGELNGNIFYYENIGTSYQYDFNLISNFFADISVIHRSNPEFYDIDNDNDFDLLIGSGYNNIIVYENIGNECEINFALDESFDIPYLGLNTSPVIYNSNNYIALVSGVSTGGMYFAPIIDNIVGDLNNDLLVNIFDIVLLVDYILYGSGNLVPLEFLDINNDDFINIVDIVDLVQLILNN